MNLIHIIISIVLSLSTNVCSIGKKTGHLLSTNTQSIYSVASSNSIDPVWGLEKINADLAWHFSSTQNEILIGVCDSGIDISNPYLSSVVDRTLSRDFLRSDLPPLIGETSLEDYCGHGTHVAGTIAGLTAEGQCIGVASYSNIKLVSLKVFDDHGNYRPDTLPQAIDYAKNNGINILNFSGYCYDSDALRETISEYPGVIVAAAGNISQNIASEFLPAAYQYDNIISVGATDFNDQRACFGPDGSDYRDYLSSNYGQYVDIYAPGKNTFSAVSGQNPGFGAINSGTSMAAPLVTGTVAMMMALNNGLSPLQIKNILFQTADSIEIFERSGDSTSLRLNSGNAVSSVSYNCIGGEIISANFLPLSKIVIPNVYYDADSNSLRAIEKIGQRIFENRTGIEAIDIEANVSLIGDYAFYGCSEIRSISKIKDASIGHLPFPLNNDLEIIIDENILSDVLVSNDWDVYLPYVKVQKYADGQPYKASLAFNAFQNDDYIHVITLFAGADCNPGFLASGEGIVGFYYSVEYFAELSAFIDSSTFSVDSILININVVNDQLNSIQVLDEYGEHLSFALSDSSLKIALPDQITTFYVLPSDGELGNITFSEEDISIEAVTLIP